MAGYLSKWRKALEGGVSDSLQVLFALVTILIGSYVLWGAGGFLIAAGIVGYLDIRIDDLCNALDRE